MSFKKVRKVIIPVAGFGTRFLPATKAIPKEMLPIIDKPVIQYIVEEAVAAGIEDVILVTSHMKRPVEDHFDDSNELENWLAKQGKKSALEEIKGISKLANFIYVRQKGPYGNATPVKNVEHIIGDEPFAVLFGDDVFDCKTPRLRQMLDVYEQYGGPVLASIKTDKEGTKKFGIINPGKKLSKHVSEVKGIIEKPGPEKAPSLLATVGGYVLTPDIFKHLAKLKKNSQSGEFILVDAIAELMKERPMYAVELDGRYHDTGSKLGWLEANIAFALKRPDMKDGVKKMLKRELGK